MEKITNLEELRDEIERLERKSKFQQEALRERAHGLYEQLKPGNILKNSFNQFIHEPGKKGQVVNALLGVGAGFLLRRFMPGKQASIVKKAVGTALQVGVANLVASKAGSWKKKFGRLFGRKKDDSHDGTLSISKY